MSFEWFVVVSVVCLLFDLISMDQLSIISWWTHLWRTDCEQRDSWSLNCRLIRDTARDVDTVYTALVWTSICLQVTFLVVAMLIRFRYVRKNRFHSRILAYWAVIYLLFPILCFFSVLFYMDQMRRLDGLIFEINYRVHIWQIIGRIASLFLFNRFWCWSL